MLLDFDTYGGFVFIEEVADHSFSNGLLLPDRNAHVCRRERVSVGIEVDDLTTCIGAEAVIRGGEPPKRVLYQQRFHGQQIHGCSSSVAGRTAIGGADVFGIGSGTAAELLHADDYQP